MKKLLLTIFAALFILACGTAQTRHASGVKNLAAPEISNLSAAQNIAIIDTGDDYLQKQISLANLVTQLNIATGNITQEEVEDILASVFTNGTHSGASFTYNDNGAGAGTISINVPTITDTNDFPTSASLTGNVLTITIPGQSDVTVDLGNLNTGGSASDSPVQNIEHWIGTTLQFNNRIPLPNVVYHITDSIPSLPVSQLPIEGSFTPTVVDGNNVNYTISESNCTYYKLGKQVSFRIRLKFTHPGSPSGILTIQGLPFDYHHSTGNVFATNADNIGSTSRAFDDIIGVASGSNDLVFKIRDNGDSFYSNWTNVQGSSILHLSISGTYISIN